MTKIQVKSTPITLGQFLKLANIAQDGLEAKYLIVEGLVSVNGEIDQRRGRKLYQDDIIQVTNGEIFMVNEQERT